MLETKGNLRNSSGVKSGALNSICNPLRSEKHGSAMNDCESEDVDARLSVSSLMSAVLRVGMRSFKVKQEGWYEGD